jgi:hypothetical protein
VISGKRRWALGVGLWVNKQYHNLILPLPWWERTEVRGIYSGKIIVPPSPLSLSFGRGQDHEPVERPSREG